MCKNKFEITKTEKGGLIKTWTKGVSFEEEAKKQLKNLADLPFIYKWVAAMPDVHLGRGATIGSVIPTKGAIIPAAVGVDIGCGMMAAKTSLKASDLPESLAELRSKIEKHIPVGKNSYKYAPKRVEEQWSHLAGGYDEITSKHKLIKEGKRAKTLGTLGGGNHFIEICLDEDQNVWIMLHSGSRGLGNNFGRYFIELAKKDMAKHFINLPDNDLSYFVEGTDHFIDYVQAVSWAQKFAKVNREVMMQTVLTTMRGLKGLPDFSVEDHAINCHHNYVEKESHYDSNVYITRKGAVRARKGELGIIPGSMGAKSFIVRGLGNPESFNSCSHGAGRVMSRTKARQTISLEEHLNDTKGVECRKDKGVIDESPKAYKDIDAVMKAQDDLVEIVHTLKQIVCVKG